MNSSNRFIRPLAVLAATALILVVVVQFAPAVQAPDQAPESLTTRVAAATSAPETTAPAPAPTVAPAPPDVGVLYFSAERAGRQELYAAGRADIASPERWRQLTRGYSPARAPALSPDGTRLAFQSRRDGNWEIYVLDLGSGASARLTNALAYDGAPTWSPDGKQLAFESYRSQDLDIWKMNADGSLPVNLTPEEPAFDFDPAWSPSGDRIVFTSWADGHKQLYSMTPDGKNLVNLSRDRFHDEQSAFSPDGRQLAFVSNREGCVEHVEASLEQPPAAGSVASGNCQRRAIYLGDLNGAQLSNVRQLTFFGRDESPAWSPDGKQIVFVSPRPSRQPLFTVPAAGGLPQAVSVAPVWILSASWGGGETPRIGSTPVTEPPLYVEKPIPSNPLDGTEFDFVGLKEVYLAPSYGILSSSVSESFRALRARVLSDSGVDFLARLSDMTRLVDYKCDNTCDDLSWHKSGRAVDTLLTLPIKGVETVVLVREDVNAEVYWHVYLRTAKQDGSQGEPLTDPPWNLSYNARAFTAPGLGGLEDPPEYGYYVDFTELARQYGWSRISSHDDVDFDWHTNQEALEFWHFQKEDGLNWWQAMHEVYPPSQLDSLFDWNRIVNDWGKEPSRVYLKSVPPPPDAWKWFALVPPE